MVLNNVFLLHQTLAFEHQDEGNRRMPKTKIVYPKVLESRHEKKAVPCLWFIVFPMQGFEPRTFGLSHRHSHIWATQIFTVKLCVRLRSLTPRSLKLWTFWSSHPQVERRVVHPLKYSILQNITGIHLELSNGYHFINDFNETSFKWTPKINLVSTFDRWKLEFTFFLQKIMIEACVSRKDTSPYRGGKRCPVVARIARWCGWRSKICNGTCSHN